jgi:outer membrane protein assembly factor BamB
MALPSPIQTFLSLVLVVVLCGATSSEAAADEPVVRISYGVRLAEQGLFAFGPLELAAPALTADSSRLVVGTSKGDLFLIDSANGKIVAQQKLVGGMVAAPTMVGDSMVVGTNDGRVYRLSSRDLVPEWEKPAALKGSVVSQPRVWGDLVFVQDDRSILLAIRLDNGKVVGRFDGQSFARRGLSPFTIYGYPELEVADSTLYAGFETGIVARFPLSSEGEFGGFAPTWEAGICAAGSLKTSDSSSAARLCSPRRVFRDVDSSPTLTDSGLLTGCYCRGLVMLDPEEGAVLWERPVLGPSSPAVLGGHAAVAAADGQLYAVSLKDGKIRWQTRIETSLLSRPGVLGAAGDIASTVLVVATGDSLFFVNGNDGAITARLDSLGGIAAPPVTAGNVVFVISNEGLLYRLDYFR